MTISSPNPRSDLESRAREAVDVAALVADAQALVRIRSSEGRATGAQEYVAERL